MEMNIKQRIASGALAIVLLGGTGASVAAERGDVTQRGGAAGLVAAVVQANVTDVVTVTDSLNNLTALNNILNNSPFLNDITVSVLDGSDITILTPVTVDNVIVTVGSVLSGINVDIDDVVAIVQVLGGGVVVVV